MIITRPEIVTLGDPSINPNKAVGKYVEPKDWNQLIRDPNVRVIDTRNEYEVKVGTFKGAENPHTDTFGQWPEYVKNELRDNKKQKSPCFAQVEFGAKKPPLTYWKMGLRKFIISKVVF